MTTVEERITDYDIECHACLNVVSGYPMAELVVEHGWRLHSTRRGQPHFVMCADCERKYEERRARADLPA